MEKTSYRSAIENYIRAEAQPPDKFSHQARLYKLARILGEGQSYDDEILHAAAWLHDLGIFTGHRPADPAKLSGWDHVAYAMSRTPELLQSWSFPMDKIPAVVEAIRTHLPSAEPTSLEGMLLRDADLLEQLGAVGVLRTVGKVGRDTRLPTFGEAIRALRKQASELPSKLRLPRARELAAERIGMMQQFLQSAEKDSQSIDW